MASSYNAAVDRIPRASPRHPVRSAYLCEPAAAELPAYGSMRVYVPGDAVSVVTVVAADARDDNETMTLHFPPGVTVDDNMIVRRVVSATNGAVIHIRL